MDNIEQTINRIATLVGFGLSVQDVRAQVMSDQMTEADFFLLYQAGKLYAEHLEAATIP